MTFARSNKRHRTPRRSRAVLGVVLAIAALGVGCVPSPAAPTRDQQVDEIISFVEAVRGHSFITKPVVQFVPDAEFQQHVLDSLQAAEPGLNADEVAFKALGWMPAADSLYAKYRIAFGGAVVGFYDPVSKVLEVRGSELTAYRKEVVAHELTHALDDQLFDLNESFGDGVLSEAQNAFLVAVEGSAVRVQRAFVATLSPLEQLQSISEQLSFPIDPQLLTVPIALLSLSQAAYLQGPEFIAGLGGNAGIDAMFDRYPVTEEQAWFPSKYLANEAAVPVPTPPADGPIVKSGSWGQFLMTLVVNEGVSLDAAVNPVTNGWAGDAFVTWTVGSERCIRIDTKSDTPAQADGLRAALTGWAGNRADASAVAVDSTTTRLTSCV